MKYLTIIANTMILISSYLFTAEYPHQGKLIRQQAFRKKNLKSFAITLHNNSHYDISTENLVIVPGESKKIQLPENLKLKVLVYAFDDPFTLNFDHSLPQNVYFNENSDLIELIYDKDCIKKYIL